MPELIDHKIKIDEYTELTLKIPDVMTPIELKALMYKANKIFNLSDVPIIEKNYQTTSRHGRFNYEMKQKLYKLKEINKVDWKIIEDELGISKNVCMRHISYLKTRNEWNESLLLEEKKTFAHNELISWNEEMEEKLVRLKVIENKSWKEVANEFVNISKKKLMSKFGNMKFQKEGERIREIKEKLRGEDNETK